MRFQNSSAFAPVTARDLVQDRPLVVLAPHPDDETLGCGDLLAVTAAAGTLCHVVCVTDGAASHPRSRRWAAPHLADLRRAELIAALKVLGPIDLHMMGHPDCGAPSGGAAVGALSALVPKGALLLSTWAGDPHVDHQSCAALAAAVAAARPDIAHLAYPVWGRLRPDLPFPRSGWRLTDRAPAKAAALACHASQMTGLIDDDPEGFVMDPALQALFLSEEEVFLAP
ncbi:PIG-L deacetylase family protein [Falsirhodobacter algicola]|uniref:PIG-L family deacetylase n=1 Tax=Falsirhodobacter algicola TaxID=2692330 RepID=A0A8J8SL80_9RHOB|nr:PIG-L deacetylase family protein [Falsirhodobacter algicola]QUS36134.1 PIG-L family deacetylase [Falsirhodobacter algicola]